MRRWLFTAAALAALTLAAPDGSAGQERGKGKPAAAEAQRGKEKARAKPGQAGKSARAGTKATAKPGKAGQGARATAGARKGERGDSEVLTAGGVRRNRGVRANAPSFCRSGAGHPNYGRQWCIDKGFGLGGDVRWDRADWGGIVLDRRGTTRGAITQGTLGNILGSVILGRLLGQQQTLGYREPLVGTWLVPAQGPAVLQVRSGRAPVAELVDINRDGDIDWVLLNFGR